MDKAFIAVESLQNLLVDIATSGAATGEENVYSSLRTFMLSRNDLKNLTPRFLETNRTKTQFWQFIKGKFPTYAERRQFLYEEFGPALLYLEGQQKGVADQSISNKIEQHGQDYITTEWKKALERVDTDPEGALTSARTLLETTCKYILDKQHITYKDDADLPKLYKLTADSLNLAPDQHTEQIFKQILGGCHTVVEGLGALRNKLSDSHGKKVTQVKPSARHSHLAVNLAGSMTTFLLETYEFKTN